VQYSKIEMWITLPSEMIIEQIELQISNYEIFSKYLRFLKIEKNEEDEKGMLLIRGGIEDSKKQ
jgi:hypothetical protein